MMGITPKQMQCLEAVRAEMDAGNLPTLKRLAERLSLRAESTVKRSLDQLEKRGRIRRIPMGWGAIEIL